MSFGLCYVPITFQHYMIFTFQEIIINDIELFIDVFLYLDTLLINV